MSKQPWRLNIKIGATALGLIGWGALVMSSFTEPVLEPAMYRFGLVWILLGLTLYVYSDKEDK